MQLALDFEAFDKADGKASTENAAAANSGEEQPNAIDAPDKGENDAAAAKTEQKKPETIVPGSSPILDEEVSLVGISNKVHKKTINLIQVMYVKTATNALV